MRNLILVTFLIFSIYAQAISQEDANKFVNKYDDARKKILGFINCVTHVLTGEDAVTPMDSKDSEKFSAKAENPDNLGGCFQLVGFKMGGGFSKLTAMFSKGGNAPSSLNTQSLEEATKAVQQQLVKENSQSQNSTLKESPSNLLEKQPSLVPSPEKVLPPREVSQQQAKPQSASKIKTAW